MSEFYVSGAPERQEPRSLAERTDQILAMMNNPSVLGAVPSPAQRYEAEIRRLEQTDPPAQSLANEMVMLGASLAFPAARALPYAVRMGGEGIASIRALSTEAEQAANAIVRSYMNRLGRVPFVQELTQALGIAPDVGVNRATGLGNTFKGRTPEQVQRMFETKGFNERWRNPRDERQRSYVNPETNRPYHVDPEPRLLRDGRIELPHVDAHRPRSLRGNRYQGPLEDKRRWPLGENLYDRD
ncbi:MAG: hypothetical protein IT562_10935 [Alphaproteobacteria bacterium]|nr:hypothetical protein [Alphaproteobacteria bacterium]